MRKMLHDVEERKRVKASQAYTWTKKVYSLDDAEGVTTEEIERHARAMHFEVLKRGNPFAMTIYDCYTYLYIRYITRD